MSRLRKTIMLLSITAFIVFFSPTKTFSQGPPDPNCDPLDPLCPIDGGLTLLLAVGVGLGAKKAFKKSDSN